MALLTVEQGARLPDVRFPDLIMPGINGRELRARLPRRVPGTPIAQGSFIAIDDGVSTVEREAARVSASDGVHVLTGSEPCGVIVVGYDAYDSYAYPGGLDQQIINPIN